MVPVPWIVPELVSVLMVPSLTIPELFDLVPFIVPELVSVVIVEAPVLRKLPLISEDVVPVPVVESVPELVRLAIVEPEFKIPWALDVIVPALFIFTVPVVSLIAIAASSVAVESLRIVASVLLVMVAVFEIVVPSISMALFSVDHMVPLLVIVTS